MQVAINSPSFTCYSEIILIWTIHRSKTFHRETLSQYRCHQIAPLSRVSDLLEKVRPDSVSELYYPRRTLLNSSGHCSTSTEKKFQNLCSTIHLFLSKKKTNSSCSPILTTARSLEFASGMLFQFGRILIQPLQFYLHHHWPQSYPGLGISSTNHLSGTSVLSSSEPDSLHFGWRAYLEGHPVSGWLTPDLLKE